MTFGKSSGEAGGGVARYGSAPGMALDGLLVTRCRIVGQPGTGRQICTFLLGGSPASGAQLAQAGLTRLPSASANWRETANQLPLGRNPHPPVRQCEHS